jgi:hypothetical protein
MSALTLSIMSWSSSSLFAMCAYRVDGPVSKTCATRRMLTASMPSSATMRMAASTICSRSSGGRAVLAVLARPGVRQGGVGRVSSVTVLRPVAESYLTRTLFEGRTLFC